MTESKGHNAYFTETPLLGTELLSGGNDSERGEKSGRICPMLSVCCGCFCVVRTGWAGVFRGYIRAPGASLWRAITQVFLFSVLGQGRRRVIYIEPLGKED